jgi:glyoxylase-like metal-dependent hydrolase (beta-lactamase superfamily II)
MIGSKETGECFIVDPLLDIEFIMNETKTKSSQKIVGVIDTHTHADHISGARNLVKMFNLQGVYMHNNSGSKFKTIPVQDGQTLRLGNVELQFIYTPGHTNDHMCVLADNSKVLTGDTMLIGDVGRIDMGGDPRENSDRLYDSLHKKLLKLDDSVEIFPLHIGEAQHLKDTNTSSTIGKERVNNPALKPKNKDEFFKYMTEDWPPKPPDYQNIIKLNRGETSIENI